MLTQPNRRRAHRRRVRALVDQVKAAGRCGVCGAAAGPALTFHHLAPESKRFAIGDATRQTLGAVRAEMGRCTLACRPCHDRIHRGEIDGAGLAPLEL